MMSINELIATDIINRANVRINEICNEKLKAEQDIKNKRDLIKMYDNEISQQVSISHIMYNEINKIKAEEGDE